MLSPVILIPAVLNGLMTGAIYALIALGLTLIYGVLHIINFAHGALLTAAMFRGVLRVSMARPRSLPRRHRSDAIVFQCLATACSDSSLVRPRTARIAISCLWTLGLAVVIENALLYVFRADTRTINLPYAFNVVELGAAFIAVPRVIAFIVVMAVALVLWLIMQWTDTGKAIRAVAKEKLGAELTGIDVAHVYAVTFGLGTACLAIAACLLIPTYYVNPSAGNAFVLIAFTIVVLGAWARWLGR